MIAYVRAAKTICTMNNARKQNGAATMNPTDDERCNWEKAGSGGEVGVSAFPKAGFNASLVPASSLDGPRGQPCKNMRTTS